MAKKDLPFNDDIMTLIMGVEPSEPGQHGRTIAPKPGNDAIDVITQIRDLCEDFLMRAGKDEEDTETEDNMDEEVEEDER